MKLESQYDIFGSGLDSLLAPIVEDKSIKTGMLLFDEGFSSVMSALQKIVKDPHKTAVVHL
jgi:hypothetical protein